MSHFVEWLEKISEGDARVRAVLRRSLAFEPGTYPSSYPYVEPFVKDEDSAWKREVLYLVAGLWALHRKEGNAGKAFSLGKACALYQLDRGSESTERRFIALLGSDRDQLPNRLRQMISLLKEQPIDFDDLLKRLLYWSDDKKGSQNAWARDFYRTLNPIKESEEMEITE